MAPLTLAEAIVQADWQAAALLLLLGLVQTLEALPTEEAEELLRVLDADDAPA